MHSDLYWIEHSGMPRLAIMARPRAGDWLEDEIDFWKSEGVERVVSLLERDEVSELGLQTEAACCQRRGIAFSTFPIPDRGIPADLDDAIRFIRRIGDERGALAIHCRAGIGRSSMIAASVLALNGLTADAAFRLIGTARGVTVPDTEIQREWVETFCERLHHS
jgi:protein-tyrosine phosphatase